MAGLRVLLILAALAATAAPPAAGAPRPDARAPGEQVPAVSPEDGARAGSVRRPDPVGLDAPATVAGQKAAARRDAAADAREPEAGGESEEPGASDTLVFGALNAPGLARGASGPSPPDTTGAIGTTRYVEVTNDDIAVYDRSNLALVGSPLDLAAFAGFPSDFVVDPQIMWDSTSNRFYVVTVERLYNTSGPGGTEAVQDFINVMWTVSDDPTNLTGGWCRFRFPTDNFGGAGEADDRYYFDDYPKLGDNASHLVIGVNVFEHDKTNGRTYLGGNRPFRGSRIWTIRKPNVPSGSGCGTLGTPTAFGAPTDVTGSRYPDSDGNFAFTPVPAIGVDGSATGYVVATDNTAVARQDLNVWTVNSGGVVTLTGEVPVSNYAIPADVPQRTPGLGTLDSLDGRLYQAFVTQDPDAGAPGLWTAHTIAGGEGAMVRGYEVLPATRVLRQTFNFPGAGGSGLHTFNGIIAPARNGRSAAVSFNTGGASSNVDLRARARQAGSALGAFEPSIVLGTSPTPPASATGCDNTIPPTTPVDPCRWGDYAGLSPDPLGSTTVWGSGQLQGAAGNSDWTTRNFAVTSNSLPTVTLAASTTTAPTGTPITFTASAADPDAGGSIAAVALDLDGDGSFETPGASGTRSFPVPGTYTVRAQATDNAGDDQVAAVQVTITNRAPVVSLSGSPAATAVNRLVTLTAAATDPDGTIASFAFDLNGDNAFGLATGATPTTTTRFTSAGSKVVRVRATDDRGTAGIGQATVLVRAFAVTGSVPSRQKLKTVRKKGLRTVATCPDGCRLRADLVVDAASAKKLKINRKKKATVIGSVTATLVAGRATTLTVKLSKKLGKRLKQIKGLKLSIKLSASDTFANRDAETLGVKLKAK